MKKISGNKYNNALVAVALDAITPYLQGGPMIKKFAKAHIKLAVYKASAQGMREIVDDLRKIK